MMASITNSLVSQPLPSPRCARFWSSMIFLLMISIADFDHWPIIMLMMMHRQFAVLTSQYPKQPLQHGRDEDEGGTPPHHTAAGIHRVITLVFFFKTFLADSGWIFRRRKNNLIISVRPLLTPEHGRGGSPDQRNSQVIFTKLLQQSSQNYYCNHDKIIIANLTKLLL